MNRLSEYFSRFQPRILRSRDAVSPSDAAELTSLTLDHPELLAERDELHRLVRRACSDVLDDYAANQGWTRYERDVAATLVLNEIVGDNCLFNPPDDPTERPMQ